MGCLSAVRGLQRKNVDLRISTSAVRPSHKSIYTLSANKTELLYLAVIAPPPGSSAHSTHYQMINCCAVTLQPTAQDVFQENRGVGVGEGGGVQELV